MASHYFEIRKTVGIIFMRHFGTVPFYLLAGSLSFVNRLYGWTEVLASRHSSVARVHQAPRIRIELHSCEQLHWMAHRRLFRHRLLFRILGCIFTFCTLRNQIFNAVDLLHFKDSFHWSSVDLFRDTVSLTALIRYPAILGPPFMSLTRSFVIWQFFFLFLRFKILFIFWKEVQIL